MTDEERREAERLAISRYDNPHQHRDFLVIQREAYKEGYADACTAKRNLEGLVEMNYKVAQAERARSGKLLASVRDWLDRDDDNLTPLFNAISDYEAGMPGKPN